MSAQHPDHATLVEVASGNASSALGDAVVQHAQRCATCAQRLAGLQTVLEGAQAPPAISAADHHAAKARLLAALPAHGAAAQQRGQRWRSLGGMKLAASMAVVVFSGGALALGITAAAESWFERPSETRALDRAGEIRSPKVPAAVVDDASKPEAKDGAEDSERLLPIEMEKSEAASGVSPKDTSGKPDQAGSKARQRASAEPTSKSAPAPAPAKIVPPTVAAPAPEKEAPSAVPHRKVAIASGAKTALDVAKATERNAKTAPAGAPEWIGVGDLYAQAGEAERAGKAYLEALKGAGAKTARQRLTQVAAADPSAARTLLTKMRAEQADHSAAEALRLRCEWGLRIHADRQAVLDCRAFGQRHPEHPAMRTLALAAGETAERRLSDCRLAIGEYSRALLLGKTSGIATAGALVARARCREQVGEAEEARADLKLYLVMRPAGAYDDAVQGLAKRLGATDLIEAAKTEPSGSAAASD